MTQQSYKQLYEHLFEKYKTEKIHNSDILSRKDKQLQLFRRKLRQIESNYSQLKTNVIGNSGLTKSQFV